MAPNRPAPTVTTSVEARLPVRLPFHADAMFRFLAARAVPTVEWAADGTYRRTLRLPHGPGVVALDLAAMTPGSGERGFVTAHLTLTDGADADVAIARCRHLLDADADAAAIATTLAADPSLRGSVTADPGLRVPGTVDGPEILIRALVGQQVSVAAARTALGKLTAAADERLPRPIDGLTHLFPSPASIDRIGVGAIAGPRRRAAAIAAAAHDMAQGRLVIDGDRRRAELTAELVARSGIGPWTAGYVAMRVLREPDVLLTGDLALRHGAAMLGLPDAAAELASRGTRWSPYRSYAGMYLWQALAGASVQSA